MIKKMLAASLITITTLVACSLQNLPPLPTRSTPRTTNAPTTGTISETTTTVAVVDEDAVPRELAERLAGYYGFGSGQLVEPEILIGKLPPDLEALPIPDGASVLGSLVRGDTGSEAILDTKQDPKGVLAFFNEQLKAIGWTTPTVNMRGPGGFVPPELASTSYFCKSEDGPSLAVNARALDSGTTDVRLTYMTQKGLGTGFTQCKQPPGAMMGAPLQLPTLIAPAGVRQIGGGAGGGPDRYSTYTTLVTSMTVASLLDHYAVQLEKSGWTRGEAGGDGPVAWSRWTSKDAQGKAQNGLLFVLEESKDAPQRFVYLQVALPGSSGAVVRETFTQLVRTTP